MGKTSAYLDIILQYVKKFQCISIIKYRQTHYIVFQRGYFGSGNGRKTIKAGCNSTLNPDFQWQEIKVFQVKKRVANFRIDQPWPSVAGKT